MEDNAPQVRTVADEQKIATLRSLVRELRDRVNMLEKEKGSDDGKLQTTTAPTADAKVYSSMATQTEPFDSKAIKKRAPSPIPSYPLHELLLPVLAKKEESKEGVLRPMQRLKMEVVIETRSTQKHGSRSELEHPRASTALMDPEPAIPELDHDTLQWPIEPDRPQVSDPKAPESKVAGTPNPVYPVKDEPIDAWIPPEQSPFDEKPEVKNKKAFELDEQSVQLRLSAVGAKVLPVHLDPFIRDVTVSRAYTSRTFGGPALGTFPRIAAEYVEAHGYNNFMYMNLNWNPNAPRFPGDTGLWFCTSPAEGERPVQRVFVRQDTNMWLYMGQYELVAAASLTQIEWLSQFDNVRKTWATEIWWRDWGLQVRASIVLRRDNGREPTKAEILAACGDKQQKFRNLTIDEITTAFDKGEQLLGVWAMKCIAYDDAFQKRLAGAYPAWKALQMSKIEPAAKKTPAVARRKRKSMTSEKEKRSKEVEIIQDEEDEVVEEFVPRGTRSRPRLSL